MSVMVASAPHQLAPAGCCQVGFLAQCVQFSCFKRRELDVSAKIVISSKINQRCMQTNTPRQSHHFTFTSAAVAANVVGFGSVKTAHGGRELLTAEGRDSACFVVASREGRRIFSYTLCLSKWPWLKKKRNVNHTLVTQSGWGWDSAH